MQINHLLEIQAINQPDKEALWHLNQWHTYGQINAQANKLANFLTKNGITKGDRVAILSENSPNYVIAYFATLKISAVTVALNIETTTDSLVYLLNDSNAKCIIANKRSSRLLIPALKKTPHLKLVIIDQEDISDYEQIAHFDQARLSDIMESESDAQPRNQGIDVDLASIVYTSGSTGNPKGVMLSHLNVISNTRSIAQYLHLTSKDRIMAVLPFFYIYGQSLLTTHFLVGGSVVIDNRFAFPQTIINTMQSLSVTGFAGVPSTFLILLQKSTIRDASLPSLRYVTQAGGSLPAAKQKEVAQVFDKAKLVIMYGATEASPRLSFVPPDKLNEKWGSIGIPIPNVELAVIDHDNNTLPPNQEGEIVARGSNIMMGYWNDQEGTSKVLKNGYYHTGDLGYVDQDGFFFIVGRSKDIIKVGGYRVSPTEVEEAILQIDQVFETAVIGIQDPILGEAIKAFIVISDNTQTANDIRIQLKDKLPLYKQPTHIEFIDKLPKNQSGKILKSQLPR